MNIAPPLIQQGASVGANATVVCGTTLGRYCFVGAGAVVTRDLPAYALAYGAPARIHGWICQCGEKLPLAPDLATADAANGVTCPACADVYTLSQNDQGHLQLMPQEGS